MSDGSTLNLADLDLDEVTGKTITIQGARYRIGDYIDAGGYKVAFHLVNERSRSCLHVILIYRDKKGNANMRLRMGGVGILCVLGLGFHVLCVEDYGGAFQVQEHAGGAPITEVDAAVLRIGNASGAIERLERVLGSYPDHTVALHNLAVAYYSLDRKGDALGSLSKAIEIEPLKCESRYFLIRLLAEMGFSLRACHEYGRLRELYDYTHKIDEYVIKLALWCGDPEFASRVFATIYMKDESAKNSLGQTIDNAVRARSRALELLDRALEDYQKWDEGKVDAAILEAFHLYPDEPLARINYGLLLQRQGQGASAHHLLISRPGTVSPHLENVCWANAGFAELSAGNIDTGSRLLSFVRDDLIPRDEDTSAISPWDIPGRARFVTRDDGIIEELPGETLQLIRSSLSRAENAEQQEILGFFERKYAEAHAEMRKSSD